MKKLNSIFALAFSAAIVLTSCSQQRYSSRAKVRVNEQTKEQVVESPKEVAAITPKQMDITPPQVVAPEANKAQKPESVAPAPTKREVLKQLRSKETLAMLSEIAKNPEQVKDLVSKEDNKTKQLVEEQTGLSSGSRGVQLMILGLIVIVIGIVLSFLISGFGGLVSWIGGVIFLVGLIIWLLEML